jgi:GMP synthase (glutamine-hydrolysing)
MGVKVIRVDAEERFLPARWPGVEDPEAKRKIIGRTFIECSTKRREARRREVAGAGHHLPGRDRVRRRKTGKAHVIKSHHNVGGLPEHMKLKLVEPLRELFKDEVRRIGVELGLPRDMVYAIPFPGPGLGVRILGEVKKEYADTLRRADAIFIEELRKAGWYTRPARPSPCSCR